MKRKRSIQTQTTKPRKVKRRLFTVQHSTPKKMLLSPLVRSPIDSTYSPSESLENVSQQSVYIESTSIPESYLMVAKSKIDELLHNCHNCSRYCNLKRNIVGTMYKVEVHCPNCESRHYWESQESYHKSSLGNVQLSAAIYFSGSNFSKMKKLFSSLNFEFLSNGRYYQIVKDYLQPAIFHVYKEKQEELLSTIREEKRELTLSGDMRADSPGHCAKYGSYSLLDSKTNKIVHFELVQSNEVGGSSHMEKEGLIRCINKLNSDKIIIKQLITDRHPVVQKLLREIYPNIEHKYDVWHIAKGLSKKLTAITSKNEHKDLKPWTKSISNHLYWTATSSKSANEAIAKWTSLSNHICNIHSHSSEFFEKCLHEELLRGDNSKAWIQRDSPSDVKFSKIVHDKRLLAAVRKMSSSHQTSALESFHSSLLQFAPKNTVFSYKGMLSRLMLAVLSFNENAERSILIDPVTTKPKLKTKFPKMKKGGFSFSKQKGKQTSKFIDNLMKVLVDDICIDPLKYQQPFRDISVPLPLNSNLTKPSVSDKILARRY